jgi:hypothetical protein
MIRLRLRTPMVDAISKQEGKQPKSQKAASESWRVIRHPVGGRSLLSSAVSPGTDDSGVTRSAYQFILSALGRYDTAKSYRRNKPQGQAIVVCTAQSSDLSDGLIVHNLWVSASTRNNSYQS